MIGSRRYLPSLPSLLALEALDRLGVAHDARIVSAHRTPARLVDFAKGAADEGFKVIIAGAGGAAQARQGEGRGRRHAAGDELMTDLPATVAPRHAAGGRRRARRVRFPIRPGCGPPAPAQSA